MLAAPKPAAEDLLTRLDEARRQSDDLFAAVRTQFLYERPIPERHRIIFYIGHLEAFDWNLFRERLIDEKPFDAGLDHLFAFGIDPVDGGLPSDQPSDWPAIDTVRAYVKKVRSILDSALPPALHGSHATSAHQLLNVAVEHRLMHAETLAYMLHQLPLDQKVAPALSPESLAPVASPAMIEIPAGPVTLGLSRSNPASFGWDNEYEAHDVDVPAFAIDKYKISNRQYLQFLDSGGYDDPAFWTAADWQWRKQNAISHPVFWKKEGDAWLYRTMFRQIPLPLDWPVYVSHAEASAYACWAHKSLPTEAQWQRAAFGSPAGQNHRHSLTGNFDFQRWDPVPVGAPQQSDSPFAVSGMYGNGWEWTSSLFAPFHGFEAFPFYPGYSANFFDGQHYVMKGASARTAACMMRPSFRNWFQPRYQYVYSAFRCVSN